MASAPVSRIRLDGLGSLGLIEVGHDYSSGALTAHLDRGRPTDPIAPP